MKKSFAILLILMLVLVLPAGCGGNDSPAASGDNDQNAVGVGGGANTDPDPLAPAESSPASSDTADNSGVSGFSDKLAVAYIDILDNGVFYMKYRTETEIDGQIIEAITEIATDGDDTAFKAQMAGMESQIIIKDYKMYIVDHESKTIITSPASPSQRDGLFPDGALVGKNSVFKGSGTAELFGVPHDYEEYTSDGGDMRFFFEGGRLAGMETVTEGQPIQMEILEMNDKIPAGMFDIPDGYEISEVYI